MIFPHSTVISTAPAGACDPSSYEVVRASPLNLRVAVAPRSITLVTGSSTSYSNLLSSSPKFTTNVSPFPKVGFGSMPRSTAVSLPFSSFSASHVACHDPAFCRPAMQASAVTS